jgi:hypothetical protein
MIRLMIAENDLQILEIERFRHPPIHRRFTDHPITVVFGLL